MQIVDSLEKTPKTFTHFVVTIGNFDGFHLGHQFLIQNLINTARQQQALSIVLTFSNHPSTILRPDHTTSLLCSTDHKIMLLERAGIDLVILLPFTKELSLLSADQFLQKIQKALLFQTLILGSDAHIGKNREGDRSTVTALAKRLGFTVEYFPDCAKDGNRISSSRIRECIQKGDLNQAEALLGRPYSIFGPVLKGNGRGAPLGFPTANLHVDNLCLPPLGVYAVTLISDGKKYPGVANLGLAPTVRHESSPLLEVHLFDTNTNLYNHTVDVQFHKFIRQEKKFEGLETLRNQIADDVLKAKYLHQKLI